MSIPRKILLLCAFFVFLRTSMALPSTAGTRCSAHSQCNVPYEHCVESVCQHDSVLPLQVLEVVGLTLLSMILCISNAGGIGGGAIIVPMIMIFMQFETKYAISLSNFCIFSGSLTRYFVNFRLPHPEKKAVCIDYDIAAVMLPIAILGTVLGVELNIVFPSALILLLLTFLLIFLS